MSAIDHIREAIKHLVAATDKAQWSNEPLDLQSYVDARRALDTLNRGAVETERSEQ